MVQRQQHETMGWHEVRWLFALVILAVWLFPLRGVSAQEQGLTVNLAGLTADDPSQAQVVVTVLDSDGRSVPNLTANHFQAQINQSPVPVVALARGVDSSLPIAVVLALDVSGSMAGDALEQAKLAARRFLDELGPEDSVAILTFHDTVDLLLPFTEDRDAATFVIGGLTADGATALYQATADSVHLAASADSGRRAVVLLSDGRDHGSLLSRDEALTTAQTLSVPVFAIGLGSDIDRDYLQALAQLSAGQFAETPSPEGLAQLYQEVGELLRGQYILTLDISDLGLDLTETATVRVDVAVNGQASSGERAVCPQQLCLTLSEVTSSSGAAGERTFVADVISAEAVTSVRFLVDGEPALTLTEPPYQFALDPASYGEREHTVTAEVVTAAGETQTKAITVAVDAVDGTQTSTLILGAAILAAAVGGALAFLLWRHRRGRGAPAPTPVGPLDDEPMTEFPPEQPEEPRPKRPLWEDEPRQPPPVVEEPLGRLVVTGGSFTGRSFPVGASPVSVGSGHRCHIRLSQEVEGEEQIPYEHARVWIRNGHLMVHEVRRLTVEGAEGGRWQILVPGDVFSVGPYTLRFELCEEGATESAEGPKSSGPVPNILRSAGPSAEATAKQNAPASSAGTGEQKPTPDKGAVAPGLANALGAAAAPSTETAAKQDDPAPLAKAEEQESVPDKGIIRLGPAGAPDGDAGSTEEEPAAPVPNILRDSSRKAEGDAQDSASARPEEPASQQPAVDPDASASGEMKTPVPIRSAASTRRKRRRRRRSDAASA